MSKVRSGRTGVKRMSPIEMGGDSYESPPIRALVQAACRTMWRTPCTLIAPLRAAPVVFPLT